MVTSAASLSRNGVTDWIIQRVTAVILALYTLFICGYLLNNPELTHADWVHLFDQSWVRVFTLLALLATCAHAWIGMWTIGTDYIRAHYFGRAADACRFIYLIGCVLIILVYLLWGLQILWGTRL